MPNTKSTNTKPTNTKSKRKSRIRDSKNHFLKYTDGVFELAEGETYQGSDKPSKFRCTICGDIQVVSWKGLYNRINRLRRYGRPPEDYCYRRNPRDHAGLRRIGDPKTHFLKYTDGVFELAEGETYQGSNKPSRFRCTICGDIQVISWKYLYKRIDRLRRCGKTPEDYCYRVAPKKPSKEHKPYLDNFPLAIYNLTSGVLKLDPDNQVFTNFTDRYDFTCTVCGNTRHTHINSLAKSIKKGLDLCDHKEKYETVYIPPVGMTEMTTEQWTQQLHDLTNGILIPKFYQPFMGVKGKYWFTCTECGRDHHLQYQVLKTRIKNGTLACKHKYYLINKNPRPDEFRIDVEDLSQGYITSDTNTIYVNQAEKYTYLCKCCGLTYEETFKSFLIRCKDFNPQDNLDPTYPCKHFHPRLKTNY